MARTRRVLTGQLMHETNTFSVQPADLEAFRKMYLHVGAEVPRALAGTNMETAGFIDVAGKYGWELVHTVAAFANPCGRVTDAAWNELSGRILRAARGDGPFDGALLALHGAMVTESHDDAEGQLLEELRAVVGRDLPLAVTIDLHANVSDRMAALADVVCSYRTYPHVDMRATGRRAAELLERMMEGEIHPRIVLARRPMLWGANTGRTDEGPMIDLLARAARFEAKPEVHCVAVNAGFPLSDIFDVGPTVLVAGEGDEENLRAMAEALADDLWSTRDVITNTFYAPREAAAIAAAHDGGGRPLVIADFADNPGAGAYGDATNLLKAMLDAGLENAAFACIRDEEAAARLAAAGPGATVTLDLGGKVDPAFGGPPLTLTGEVRSVTDGAFVCDGPMWQGVEKHLGPTAVFRVGGTDIIVASHLLQVTDLQTFLSQGIDPHRKRTLAVKSMQHFRAAFEPIASRVIVADSGGLASPNIGRLTYRKVRRPIHPLDADARP